MAIGDRSIIYHLHPSYSIRTTKLILGMPPSKMAVDSLKNPCEHIRGKSVLELEWPTILFFNKGIILGNPFLVRHFTATTKNLSANPAFFAVLVND